jgi:hypothetical protein
VLCIQDSDQLEIIFPDNKNEFALKRYGDNSKVFAFNPFSFWNNGLHTVYNTLFVENNFLNDLSGFAVLVGVDSSHSHSNGGYFGGFFIFRLHS